MQYVVVKYVAMLGAHSEGPDGGNRSNNKKVSDAGRAKAASVNGKGSRGRLDLRDVTRLKR